MILALDVGNSNIVLGCIKDGAIVAVSRVGTDRTKTADEYAVDFRNVLRLNRLDLSEIEGSIISSVVPPLIITLKNAVFKLCGHAPLVVGPGVKTGLNIKLDNPAAMGSDLVVAAVASLSEYPTPQILFDMGTATTVSVINKSGDFLGGMIIPGVKISQEALADKASLLPSITFEKPKKLIGSNTIDAMKSGVLYGNAAMIDGLTDYIDDELGEACTVIATGGLSRFIVPHCKKNVIFDHDLLLKGLWHIYNKNLPQKKQPE